MENQNSIPLTGNVAADMAGYGMEIAAWRLLRDVSAQLMEKSGDIPVCPHSVHIADDGGFVLVSTDAALCDERFLAPEGDGQGVWSLAATVFFVVMGCHVMNGLGGKGQHKRSKVPFMRSEMPGLSGLIQHCLQFSPDKRPSMADVNQQASKEYEELFAKIEKGPRFKPNVIQSAVSNKADVLAVWPEEMIAR